MKVNITEKLKDIDGIKPLKDRNADVTMKEILINAVLVPIQEDKQDEKWIKYEIFKKIRDANEYADLTAEEIALIKKCVGKVSPPLIMGQVWEQLENLKQFYVSLNLVKMKKAIMFLFVLMAIPIAILAQEPTDPPAGWGEVFSNPALWLGSFAGVSLLTAFLAAFLNGLFKIVNKFPKQLCAWLIAIAIVLIGDFANIKIVYTWDFPVWLAILHGLAAGLASNGWFDIPTLKKILNTIEDLFVKPTP